MKVGYRFGLLLKLFLLAVILLFLYSLIGRVPDLDDAWLGEHAYWQYKLGYVKSELMRGITLEEIRVLCHHKLFTLQGALVISTFGFSALSLKMISLVYLIFFVVIFNNYSKDLKFSKTDFYLFLLLLISNFLVFQFSFVYRPEIPIMTLGFICYIFIAKSLKVDKPNYFFPILAGFFAGLCVATHLNGVIFPIAGFILLLWNTKFKESMCFAASSIPAIMIYFYDFTKEYNFAFWLYQLRESPSVSFGSELPFGLGYIANVFSDHLRFFHSLPEISFSVMFIFVLIVGFRFLKKHKNLLRFSLLLVLSLAFISVHKTSRYMLLYLPYLLILVTLGIKEIIAENSVNQSKFRFYQVTILILIIFYVGANFSKNISIAFYKNDNEKNRNLVLQFINDQTDTCKIIAPMTFIFNEIENFKSIQSEFCYTEMQNLDSTIYQKGFLDKASFFDIDYIIGSEGFIKKVGMDTYSKKQIENCGYNVILMKKDQMILKRANNSKSIHK